MYKRQVLVQALHLRSFGLKSSQYFGLLIVGEVESFGQFRGTLGGIGRAMVVPATAVLHRRGLITGRVILSRRKRRGDCLLYTSRCV